MINRADSEEHALNWPAVLALFRKYVLLIFAISASLIVGVWLTLQVYFTELYETKASLLVKIGRENAEVPSTVQNGSVFSPGVRIADINSEVQMLSARAHVETVVKTFGVEAFRNVLAVPDSIWGYPKYYVRRTARWAKGIYKEFLILANLKKRLTEEEDAILLVEYGTKVEPVKESDVLMLKVRLPSAKLAVDTANALLQNYLARRAEVRKENAGTEFFTSQLADHQQQLERLGATRSAVRQQFGLSSPAEQRTNLLRQLSELETSVTEGQAEVERLLKERETIAGALRNSDLLPTEQVSAQNVSAQAIKQRITALELERTKLASRYVADSEVITKIDEEMADLRAMLDSEAPMVVATVTSTVNPLQKDLQDRTIRIEGLQRELEKRKEPVKRIHAELARLSEGTDAFEQAEREYRIGEQFYMLNAKKFQEARLSEDLDQRRIANVSIIAPPEMPIEPIYPRKMFIMAIAIPVALMIGLLVAALLETMEDRILTENDLIESGEMDYLGSYAVPSVRRADRMAG